MYKKFEMELAGRTLRVDVDRVAKQANGAVLMHYGDTTVLCTATASEKPREGIDFFPLSVEYNERMYAVGKIPGGFNKREGKASENAVLTDRVIDRPMRPLFPKDLRNDVSIVCTVLENDYDNSPEVVALLGASIAVSISDIPFDYVVAGCQVGIVDGKTVINPTSEQRKVSEMDVTLCATKDKIVMIEAGAKEVPEDEMFNALMEAHEELKKVCAFIQSIKDEIGKPKFEYEHHDIDHDLFDKLDAGRVEQLIRLVSEDSFGQIMITDCNPTRLRTILDKAGGEYALFTVGNGAVTQGNATATAAAADPDKGSAGNQPGNAATDMAAEPEEDKTQGQTGSAAAERTEGQTGELPAGEPARRPSEPVPAPAPAEEPAAEPDGNGARPGDAASEGGRP